MTWAAVGASGAGAGVDVDDVGTASDAGATAGSVLSGEADIRTGLADDKLDSQSLTRS